VDHTNSIQCILNQEFGWRRIRGTESQDQKTPLSIVLFVVVYAEVVVKFEVKDGVIRKDRGERVGKGRRKKESRGGFFIAQNYLLSSLLQYRKRNNNSSPSFAPFHYSTL